MSKNLSFDSALNAEAPSGTGAPDADQPRIATARGGALKPGQTEGDAYAAQADAQLSQPVKGGFIRKFQGL